MLEIKKKTVTSQLILEICKAASWTRLTRKIKTPLSVFVLQAKKRQDKKRERSVRVRVAMPRDGSALRVWRRTLFEAQEVGRGRGVENGKWRRVGGA